MEMVDSVDDFQSSHSILGYIHFPNFEMLDAKIASALKRIITNQYFRRKTYVEEQHAQKFNRFLRGKQIAEMIFEHFLAIGAHEAVLAPSDLLNVSLQGDDIQDFGTKRDKLCCLQVKYPKKMSWRVCTS